MRECDWETEECKAEGNGHKSLLKEVSGSIHPFIHPSTTISKHLLSGGLHIEH